MTQRVPAVFLDRDGTLNIDEGDCAYVHKIEDFRFIEGVVDACYELKQMGFVLVLVTNQSGIPRGKFIEEQFVQLTKWMEGVLDARGATLDGIYFCPHPDAVVSQYRQMCRCRKPQPGMLLDAQHKLNINMGASYMVGDRLEDMQAAAAAHVGTKVLVKTGKPITEQGKLAADWVLNSLQELPNLIKARAK